MVQGGVSEQTEQVLLNLSAVLHEAGLDLGAVVQTTVYMTDLGEFAAMNEVYARRFSAPHPARATVQVAALPKAASVEISAIAAFPEKA
jgi:2-iminobutanoate/2-iminopropanoate deaminase